MTRYWGNNLIILKLAGKHVGDIFWVHLVIFDGDQSEEVLNVSFRIFLTVGDESGLNAVGKVDIALVSGVYCISFSFCIIQ